MEQYSMKDRLFALLIDYLVICVYLIVLFTAFMMIYFIIMDGLPEYSQMEAQVLSFTTTVLPVTLAFSIMESDPPCGTVGKRIRGIKVTYKKRTFLNSLLRNAAKFLPWHIGHVGVIAAIYNDYSTGWFMLANAGFVLALVYLLMAVFRKDHRHIPDMLAGTKVIRKFS